MEEIWPRAKDFLWLWNLGTIRYGSVGWCSSRSFAGSSPENWYFHQYFAGPIKDLFQSKAKISNLIKALVLHALVKRARKQKRASIVCAHLKERASTFRKWHFENYRVFLFILVGFAARFPSRFQFEVLWNVFDREKGISTQHKLLKGVINEF